MCALKFEAKLDRCIIKKEIILYEKYQNMTKYKMAAVCLKKVISASEKVIRHFKKYLNHYKRDLNH